jgi:putative transposase
MILHRPLEGTVKSATIKQEANGHWFVTFVAEHEAPELPKTFDTPVGIDIGLDSFLATSDGDKVGAPRFFRKQQAKIKRASRRFSRKQKGSQNRHKARRKLACVHTKASQKRNDFLHKLSTALVEKHDVLCLEDITIAHAAKTKLHGHSKSWYDAAHGAFRRMLTYKAQWQNKSIVLTGKWFPSSQLCSACGYREKHDLSVRQWTGPCCHSRHDRDVNAAINIRSAGLRFLSLA